MKPLRTAIAWTHRYLGIVLSAFFLMWFLTGIGMIYSRGMPRLTPEVRLARLPELDLSRVQVDIHEAARIGGAFDTGLGRTTLTMVLDRPVYRFTHYEVPGVYADTGEVMPEISFEQARLVAAQFMTLPESRIPAPSLVTEPDQWTLQTSLPVYKIDVDDAAGTELYISPTTAEVVQLTTRSSRTLAWVSTIPHFLYFRSLRLNTALWASTVVWAAGLACVLAFAGILLGALYFRPSKPFRLSRLPSYVPYKGWMRLHYSLGLIFGVLTLTWAFSGLLSMEPWAWTTYDSSLESATDEAFPENPGDLQGFPATDAAVWRSVLGSADPKEIEFASILGEPHYVVRSASGLAPVPAGPDGGHQPYFIERSVDPERRVIAADTFQVRNHPFETDRLIRRLGDVLPSTDVIESELLTEYDWYYYSRDRRAPLPVVRLKLADADRTWLYIDPEVSRVVGRVSRINRVERWLYNSLHSLDFPFLYYNRPLWDAVVIGLCTGGAALSGIGLFLGLRRVLRGVKRTAAAWAAFIFKTG